MSKIKSLLILSFLLLPGYALADSDTTVPELVAVAEEAKPEVKEVTEVKLALSPTKTVSLVEPIKLAGGTKLVTPKQETPKVEPPVIHEVQHGDTLTKIAESHETVWPRIFDANTEIQDPNVISPGQKLRIPKPDEEVTPRTAPVAPAPVQAAPVARVVTRVDSVSYSAPVQKSGFVGSYGYVSAGGNCVNTAKAHGKNQPGNPISWSPSTQTPFIGAAALFYYNHVAIVKGIHPDGSLEVAHENCPGCPSRYSRGTFRGFF